MIIWRMLALGPQASVLILLSSYKAVAAHANRRAEKAHGRAVGGSCGEPFIFCRFAPKPQKNVQAPGKNQPPTDKHHAFVLNSVLARRVAYTCAVQIPSNHGDQFHDHDQSSV